MTVSSGSSSSVTPSGTVTADSVSVSFISRPETSWVIESGMSSGSASMLSSRVSWLSTPPSVTPGDSSPPVQLEHDDGVDRLVHVHAQEVEVDRLAAHRMVLDVLDDHRGRAAAVDLEVEHGAGVGERRAERQRVNCERDRLVAAAVDDAGHEALLPQAARGSRALDGARGDLERLMVRTGHGGRPC